MRKIQDVGDFEAFVASIEAKSVESKIAVSDLKDLFDRNGIYVKDGLFDQLSSFFDLDRNDQLYVTSFCEYLRAPSMKNFNFLKVHPAVLVNLVAAYVQNEVQAKALPEIEAELGPPEALANERLNALAF
jgi:hypothetical protein